MKKITRISIIDHIKNGATEKALEEILLLLPQQHNDYKNFILLNGRWKTVTTQMLLGLEDKNKLNIEFNNISNATFEFLKAIEEKYFEQQEIEIHNSEKTRAQIIELSNQNVEIYKYDIFFCFSTKDIAEARNLCDFLRGYGFKVFFSADDLRLKGGAQFSQIIDEAIEKSRHFLLYSTEESMQSKWVNLEYTTFHDQIHIEDSENRKFLIFEGPNFSQNLLRITYRNNQRVKSPEDIINILLSSKQTTNHIDIKKEVQSNAPKNVHSVIVSKKPSKKTDRSSFKVSCDGKYMGEVSDDKPLEFKVSRGEHKFLVYYNYYKVRVDDYGNEEETFTYSDKSDEMKFVIRKQTKLICGYEKYRKILFGLLDDTDGHKLFIKELQNNT